MNAAAANALRRLGAVPPAAADALLAAIVFASDYMQVVARLHDAGARVAAGTWAMILVVDGSLLLRRRAPGLVAVVVGGSVLLRVFHPMPGPTEVSLFIAAYSPTAYGRAWRAWLGAAVILAGPVGFLIRQGYNSFILVGSAAAVAAGAVRSQAERISARLEEESDQVQADRDRLERRALQEERLRIARDLHALVVEAVRQMAQHAATARSTLRADAPPEINLVEDTGRRALADMRALLKALRAAGGEGRGELDAQPGLGEVADLVARARARGIAVDLRESVSNDVPAGQELAMYRLLEALLACVEAGTATLSLTSDANELRLEADVNGNWAKDTRVQIERAGQERVPLFGGQQRLRFDNNRLQMEATLPLRGVVRAVPAPAPLVEPERDEARGWLARAEWRVRNSRMRFVTHPVAVDVLVVAALMPSVLYSFGHHPPADGAPGNPFGAAAHVWGLLWITLLLGRSRRPAATVAAMSVFAFVQNVMHFWTPYEDVLAMLLALYGVGRRSPLGTACGLVALASIGTILPQPLPIWEVGFLIVTVIEYAAAVYIGRLVTGRTRLNARLELQLQRQRRRQALDIEERVRAERTRIAREMHDLVAHAMSLMVVQAGAARMVARDDQGEADRLLAGVEASAHDALDELEHLVALLRSGDDDRADELPIAADLDALVEQVRRAGLHLDYRVEGPAAALNRSQQVSLYRVAQEALTNVRKHAHGSAVAVRLRYHPERVRLEVINRTRTNGEKRPLTSLPGAGHGLIGMRERITLLGGSFSAEARDGGFVVLAELPVKAAAPSR